ncbi:MAG: biosynthetic-type acetolactate synthase large subunit [Dehalococcoidia bacterium]|nr:biosynthetic-type acetolactate synthase large subunit [Dehalococcoidia bacterium]
MQLKGAEIICESLLKEGVDVVFGHPGGAVLPLYDALYSYPQIRHILVRHEQAAAHAADGYARVTGRPGVCIATSGPGATNLVTGIMGAKADSVPMVAITGQVARAALGSEAFQECDTCAITAPCTKKNYLVMSAADLAPTIYDAFRVAQEGRPGPTLVDIPRDVQQELADFEYMEVPQVASAPVHEAMDDNLRRAAHLINGARKPLILAGHGVLNSRASDDVLSLAEKTGIPVVNTLLGLGSFPRRHPLSLGMLGMHGMYWSNLGVDQSDLIVGLGVRFDDRIIGKPGSFAPNAKVIQVDIDPSQIGRNVPVDVGLVGGIKAVLKELLPLVRSSSHGDWVQQIDALKEEHPSLEVPESDGLLAQHVLTDLNEVMGGEGDSVVVTGVGQHQMWAAQYLMFDSSDCFVSSGGLGAMGYEVPAAMGAQVGRPESTVWSIAGDGGIQMTIQELATISDEKLPVKIALFNNGDLGMVRQWQEMFYQGHYKAVSIPGPDFVRMSEAFGIPALRVTRREDVLHALRRAKADAGPYLIEFVLKPDESVYPMVPSGATLAQTVEDPRTRRTG